MVLHFSAAAAAAAIHSLTPEMSTHSLSLTVRGPMHDRVGTQVVPSRPHPMHGFLTRPFRFPFFVVRSWLSTLRKKLARVEVKSHRGNSLVRSLSLSLSLSLHKLPSFPKLESGDLGARERELPSSLLRRTV